MTDRSHAERVQRVEQLVDSLVDERESFRAEVERLHKQNAVLRTAVKGLGALSHSLHSGSLENCGYGACLIVRLALEQAPA